MPLLINYRAVAVSKGKAIFSNSEAGNKLFRRNRAMGRHKEYRQSMKLVRAYLKCPLILGSVQWKIGLTSRVLFMILNDSSIFHKTKRSNTTWTSLNFPPLLKPKSLMVSVLTLSKEKVVYVTKYYGYLHIEEALVFMKFDTTAILLYNMTKRSYDFLVIIF
ncbi:MAG: hypothetical protein HPY70_06800 [Firmicutes bacterium]|nr:hypothetical protein [Bacillota bacterium]